MGNLPSCKEIGIEISYQKTFQNDKLNYYCPIKLF